MKKILFIEDEPHLQKIVGEILTQEGFQILSALDGESGIQTVEKEQPDLVLLDLVLPKKDGFEVLKELKENPKTKDVPVIILSNLESAKDISKALELGATTYLAKANYEIEEITKKIKSILEQEQK